MAQARFKSTAYPNNSVISAKDEPSPLKRRMAESHIGKMVAMTKIFKLMSTLLSGFEFELADQNERYGTGSDEVTTDTRLDKRGHQ